MCGLVYVFIDRMWDYYKLENEKRGLCVIINNQEFDVELHPRDAADGGKYSTFFYWH